MTRLLHIDSSARPGGSDTQAHGSHSRRLSARFVRRWRELRPGDDVIVRDVGLHPPAPVTGGWIHAAFTPPAQREPWMREALAESDALVEELLAADLVVVGVPMYNFGMPAQLKAWIDNVVRVGRTFGFDRAREGEPYWPMLADQGRQLVLLSSRGDYGYGRGERLEAINHVEPGVLTPLRYIGIDDAHSVAVEYDEFGDERLRASIERAERDIDALVQRLTAERVLREAA
ncbi:FMN-dependent NADH-azoreductase [Lysobacter enzymogenes]|uniref:FMN-dependent NADH-azoreductase n=1 Tax=Lysobacter enzymogenes TaxID=69 RepID=UPI00099C38C5|nr:NAD(P)H-dependent oxidoreductase [Lysobacter enzymogenes]QQQ01774.1 NAD(P)H-dependent oxidoreductase [Lysobacter enzymogenes]UZW61046.1 NAD(P)H-dependent oxidoreductase [Lysobacter enzymogenes]